MHCDGNPGTLNPKPGRNPGRDCTKDQAPAFLTHAPRMKLRTSLYWVAVKELDLISYHMSHSLNSLKGVYKGLYKGLL